MAAFIGAALGACAESERASCIPHCYVLSETADAGVVLEGLCYDWAGGTTRSDDRLTFPTLAGALDYAQRARLRVCGGSL